MLEILKELLGISADDSNKDNILNFYLEKAQNAIKNYCNMSDLTGLDNQIVDLALFYFNNRSFVGITQGTQGSRTQTTLDGIPQNIKDTLPLPKIRGI